jgi:hypothetical protein
VVPSAGGATFLLSFLPVHTQHARAVHAQDARVPVQVGVCVAVRAQGACVTARAKVAELVDALDLGSSGKMPWGFESPLSHWAAVFGA